MTGAVGTCRLPTVHALDRYTSAPSGHSRSCRWRDLASDMTRLRTAAGVAQGRFDPRRAVPGASGRL